MLGTLKKGEAETRFPCVRAGLDGPRAMRLRQQRLEAGQVGTERAANGVQNFVVEVDVDRRRRPGTENAEWSVAAGTDELPVECIGRSRGDFKTLTIGKGEGERAPGIGGDDLKLPVCLRQIQCSEPDLVYDPDDLRVAGAGDVQEPV